MREYSRRQFASAAVAAVSVSGSILRANDRVNVAIVGLGGRGTDHLNTFGRQPNCRIAAVCDVNQEAQERAVTLVDKLQGHKPEVYTDMRRLFAAKDVDAVSIATPNHWHALATIWACQAGKDVYVEKPACHNVFEGRKLIEAAKKYRRMVMVGSQNRSLDYKVRAIQLLSEGIIGKVYLAKGLCYKRRPSIGHAPDGPVPPGVDWDLFRGPAPMRPFNANRFKYNWHWFWDTGNGEIGNAGVHDLDLARWGLGKPGFPKSVVSTGGKYIYDDDQETPNTQLAIFDYGDCELIFETRGLPTGVEGNLKPIQEHVFGNLFYGSEGFMEIGNGGFQVYKGEKHEKVMDEKTSRAQYAYQEHFVNFLAAVRTRDAKYLTADAEVGVIAASLCHLANISYRTGRKLAFDPELWQFVGDASANRMLSREYRKPYVVPERV